MKNTSFLSVVFFNSVNFSKSEFFDDVCFKSAFDTIAILSSCKFHKNVDFSHATLPHYLDLSSVSTNREIDLTQSRINKKYGVCNINLLDTDIDKIKLKYSGFRLYFPPHTDPEIKSNIYEHLLEKQKKEGFIYSYEKLDKEYREFKYKKSGGLGHFKNWISKNWGDYGYRKGLIFRNTSILFMFFFSLNYVFFKHWISNVYELPMLKASYLELKKKNRVRKFAGLIPVSFFYTALIFFGVKFSIDKLKYQENLRGWRWGNLIYFFIMYASGLVCLGYLANYVISG